ncbi:hypothetical protein PR202_ga04260 [Eleusine coracana subsp. coracana]|uniref:ABC transporter domain-containing protein n=1 Tax=Eleusine coracana subsp. coracana TaxID=191504 RepID=A0AAV5BQQ3_ELECO|nr:hypothetical protein PR202_ga04260 [Eleusine coracana subsp. coracana]
MVQLPRATPPSRVRVGVLRYRLLRLRLRPPLLLSSSSNGEQGLPLEMMEQGYMEKKLQLLHNVTGAFQPGILSALMGVTGAGKTTLLDVLAGRKTITVGESVAYSAWLRLPTEIDSETRNEFVNQVLETIELDQIRDALVGIPGVNGLSTEQRKRLTIAVELVSNPSIIFMDEPTSGLDARAAAIVMRAVKNVAETGRTVVCTIHQPNIEIFETFDEEIPGVPRIKENYNPSTWMLEVTSTSTEAQLGIDFAQIYKDSSLFQERFAGMYSPWAYSFAQVAMEIPYVFVQIVLFMFISYPMIGYAWTPAKFFWFMYTMFCTLLYFIYLGMMMVSLTPNIQVASILASMFYTIQNLMSGYIVPAPDPTITPPTVSNSGKSIKYGRTANNPIIGCDAPTPAQLLSGRGLKKTSWKTVRKVPVKRKDGLATQTIEQPKRARVAASSSTLIDPAPTAQLAPSTLANMQTVAQEVVASLAQASQACKKNEEELTSHGAIETEDIINKITTAKKGTICTRGINEVN